MKFRVIYIICLLLVSQVFAQKSKLINFGIEDGMVNSQVKTIEQDSRGNLWIGTIAGLVKYDGVFSNYSEKEGLAENWITCSYQADDGNIYYGHWGGGITLFRDKKGQFIDLKVEKKIGYSQINDLTDNGKDELWVATITNGLFRFNKVDESIQNSKESLIVSFNWARR